MFSGIRRLALTLTVFLLLAEQVFAIGFNDIPIGSREHAATLYLQQEGIVTGNLITGNFEPDRPLTRIELLRVLVSLQRTDDEAYACIRRLDASDTPVYYSDVAFQSTAAPFVCLGVKTGIITGRGGKFYPYDAVPVVEGLKMIAVAAGLTTQDAAGEIWYAPHITALAHHNTLPSTVTSLTGSLRRGSMAEILYRLRTGNIGPDSVQYQDLTRPDGDVSVPADGIATQVSVRVGDVTIHSNARILGSVTVLRGTVTIENGAVIHGAVRVVEGRIIQGNTARIYGGTTLGRQLPEVTTTAVQKSYRE